MKLNPSVAASDVPRLTAKQEQVLARLQQGPASNRQLNEICFSYRQRLSELRQAGYQIDCAKEEASGYAVYTLVAQGQLSLLK